MFSNDIANMVKDILLFKGFKESSFKDKMKWLFVLFPFFFLVVGFFSIIYAWDFLTSFFDKTLKKWKRG